MPTFIRLNRMRATLLVLLVSLAVKLSVWAVYGPTTFPDSAAYISFADQLLDALQSRHDGAAAAGQNFTSFRMIGYPLVLAAAKLLAGDGWANAVVALQIAVSLGATVTVLTWAQGLLGTGTKAILVALSVALGQAACFDIAILTDSLFSSILIMILCILARIGNGKGFRPAFASALLCGFGVVGLILLRANGVHIALMFLPLALVILRDAPKPKAALGAALVLPALITVQAYIEWNDSRTGERFLSTSARIVAFQPLYEMARHGTNVFDGDDALSKAVRQTRTNYGYADIYDLNLFLASEYGWSNAKIARAGTAAFADAAVSEPLALIRNAGRAFGFSVIRSLFNPALALSETHHLSTRERLFPGFSKLFKALPEHGVGGIAYALVYVIGAGFSTILFIAFLVLAPIKYLRGSRDGEGPVVLSLWAGIAAMLGYYSLIHLELRYVLAAIPFIVAIGLWALPISRAFRLRS